MIAAGSPASPLSQAVRIDAACARFEADWRGGKVPSIESFLAEFGGLDEERGRLLMELLALEAELLESAGESVVPETYRRRFPDHGEVIDEVFADHRSTGGPADADGPATIGEAALGGPRRFGDYELLEEIARGGMGVVYRARQISLNRVVALKMILSGQFATEAEVRRFRAEAEAAAHLEHPGIVPIYEVGRHQGQPFFSMKLVGGGNLTRHLAHFLDDPEAAARLVATIARTVQHAHGEGMIHRDLKPSNILLDESGQPLVADFGLVKWANDASSLTASGALLGTPTYMAPEQVSGGQVTPTADVYSLGAVLYQLLTGRPPFRGATVAETLTQVLDHDPIPPRQVRPSIPRELESICLRCLEKSPSQRYPSAAALAADLQRFLRGEAIHDGQAGPGARLARWARRESEFACRLVGQSLILALTQVNYLLNPSPDLPVHLATTTFELLWILSSLRLRRVARSEARWETVRMIWVLVDVSFLTAILRILGAAESSLVIGYPMLVAASGLWNRVRLVWTTTGLSILGYSLLALDTKLRHAASSSNHHPDIILAALAVTGLVIAQQVRRIRALTAARDPSTDGPLTTVPTVHDA